MDLSYQRLRQFALKYPDGTLRTIWARSPEGAVALEGKGPAEVVVEVIQREEKPKEVAP